MVGILLLNKNHKWKLSMVRELPVDTKNPQCWISEICRLCWAPEILGNFHPGRLAWLETGSNQDFISEINRVQCGGRPPGSEAQYVDVYNEKPVRAVTKVIVPVKQHPKVSSATTVICDN